MSIVIFKIWTKGDYLFYLQAHLSSVPKWNCKHFHAAHRLIRNTLCFCKTWNSLLRVFCCTFRWHVHKRRYMQCNLSKEKQSGCLCKMILPCLYHFSLQSEMFSDWWKTTFILLTDGIVEKFYHLRCCTHRGTLNPTLNLRDSVRIRKHELKTHLLKQPWHFSLLLQGLELF